ncbi:MAG TPA: peptidylprolyl isomerase, partial [Gammaproteobacteria bacterium]|nr:peptidylprolyl isomerase [Gammaproteobacteria bacterium]
LEKGALVEFDLPTGEAVAGRIIAVADDDVTVDFNPPLSGRDFRYQIEILAAHPPGAEQQANYG